MNYSESSKILEEIKKAKNVLINCHRSPDADSFGSALALYSVLSDMGKKARVVCPSKIEANLKFLEDFSKIEVIDFSDFDFKVFDLLMVLDSSSYDRVTGSKAIKMPNMPLIVIDHHKTNTNFGDINLVDENTTSTGELLYKVFRDWEIEINKKTATALLTGIIGDTGAFQYPGVNERTFDAANYLMQKGADKDEIIFYLFRSLDFKLLEFWGEIIKQMKIDEGGKFVWSAISYEKFVELGSLVNGRETAASQFFQIVDGTDFGIVMVEQEKEKLSLSFRSRTGFDTSKIASALGGGGHIYASGAKVEGLPFDKAVEKVLQVAREYAKKS